MEKLKTTIKEKDDALLQLQKETNEKLAIFDDALNNNNNIPSLATTFPTLLENVKHLREIRSKCEISDDGKLIEVIEDVSECQQNFFLNSMEEYQHVQNEQENLKIQQQLIVDCTEKEDLLDLLDERDHIFRKYIKRIRALLKQIDSLPLKEREDQLVTAQEFIQRNFAESITLTQDLLHDALTDYKNERFNLNRDVCASRDQTNEKSSQLFKLFGQIQRELHCMLSINVSSDISSTDTLIAEYKTAIDQEIKVIEVFKNLISVKP